MLENKTNQCALVFKNKKSIYPPVENGKGGATKQTPSPTSIRPVNFQVGDNFYGGVAVPGNRLRQRDG